MSENGITTAADYKRAHEQMVTLPSGAVFELRQPSLGFRLTHLGLVQSIAAKMQAGGNDRGPQGAALQDDEAKRLVQVYYDILCEVCVNPRVSLSPPVGAIHESPLHPDDIRLEDAVFIARWAGGEVTPDGSGDLARFHRRKSDHAAPDRAGGGDVRPVAERAAEDGPDGFPV